MGLVETGEPLITVDAGALPAVWPSDRDDAVVFGVEDRSTITMSAELPRPIWSTVSVDVTGLPPRFAIGKNEKGIKNGRAGQHLPNTFKTAVMAVGRSKVIFGLAIGGNVARQFNFRQRCAQILINIQLKACG